MRLIRVFAAAGVIGIAAAAWLNSAPSTSQTLILSVSPGTPAYRVAHFLKSEGQIRSRRFFLTVAKLRGASTRLHAGSYEIPQGRTTWGILSDLIAGRTRKVRVTVPEGFASWQIAGELEKSEVCGAAEFLKAVGRSTGPVLSAAAADSAEGYLFPETYYFDLNTPPDVVRDAMLANFDRAWQELIGELAAAAALSDVQPSTGPRGSQRLRLADGRAFTQQQIVALASLVEREARKPEERVVVSAVYHNRLKKRMPLEADPTVQFSLGYWKPRILYKDLEIDSPYNTYRRRGLPPGPICSPGREALRAALSPAPVDYLYFVADVSGGHLFSSTYAEHLKKVAHWNKERRQMRIRQLRENRSKQAVPE
jgi:UPF0755 protein